MFDSCPSVGVEIPTTYQFRYIQGDNFVQSLMDEQFCMQPGTGYPGHDVRLSLGSCSPAHKRFAFKMIFSDWQPDLVHATRTFIDLTSLLKPEARPRWQLPGSLPPQGLPSQVIPAAWHTPTWGHWMGQEVDLGINQRPGKEYDYYVQFDLTEHEAQHATLRLYYAVDNHMANVPSLNGKRSKHRGRFWVCWLDCWSSDHVTSGPLWHLQHIINHHVKTPRT